MTCTLCGSTETFAHDDCSPCIRAEWAFHKASGENGDADYAYHEVAHAVLLQRRAPSSRADWHTIAGIIGYFPTGIAQLHELRVLALQAVAYRQMHFRRTFEDLVDLSWPGIADFVAVGSRGRSIIGTRDEAIARGRAMIAHVGNRSLRTYVRAIERLRAPIGGFGRAFDA